MRQKREGAKRENTVDKTYPIFMHAKRICPRCGSGSVKANGSGRFLCRGCGRTFSSSTSTVMSSMKLARERFRRMANLMLNDVKLRAIMDSVGISSRTAYVWRMKVYTAAFEMQKGAMLSGKCWIDEALVPVNDGICFRFEGGKKPRGCSRNQAVIACAVDSNGNRIALEAGRGHIAAAACVRTYGSHIAKGTIVVHDGIFSHGRLIGFLGSEDEVYKSVTRASHPKLQPVISFISELKHFLRCHGGVRTEYLGIYAAWVAFKSSVREGEIDERIGLLESFCFQTKASFKVKDRYRVGY